MGHVARDESEWAKAAMQWRPLGTPKQYEPAPDKIARRLPKNSGEASGRFLCPEVDVF